MIQVHLFVSLSHGIKLLQGVTKAKHKCFAKIDFYCKSDNVVGLQNGCASESLLLS